AAPCRAARRPSVRRAAAQPRVLRRIAQEVDDLDELVLGLVDAGDVVERDPRVALLVVAARAALADAEDAAAQAPALLGGTAKKPDVERDQQQRRPEAEQQRRQRALRLG